MKFYIPKLQLNLKDNLSRLFVLAILTFALLTGILAVDFGKHWDEHITLNTVRQSVETGILLPGRYQYPSMCYDLSILNLAGDTFRFYIKNYSRIIKFKILLDKYLENRVLVKRMLPQILTELKIFLINTSIDKNFNLRLRVMFIIITSLSIIWTYLIVISWRKIRLEALLACSLVGLSWEVAYHARWIAPDAIMMQFAALTMVFIFLAMNNPERRAYLRLSAIAAGLAIGTKYPAGLFLLPVLINAYFIAKEMPPKRFPYRILCEIILIFSLTYLVTSPGSLLDPIRFAKDVGTDIIHYKQMGHWGYTVTPGIQHFLLILSYFCFVIFSKYSIIACFFFIMALVGIFSLVRQERRDRVIVFLSFPALYILVMASQRVMTVRNLSVFVPFLAILSARGCNFLLSKFFSRHPYRLLFLILIALSLLVNALWLIKAMNSMRNRNSFNYTKQLADYIDNRPDKGFLVSARVANDLFTLDKKRRFNVTLISSDEVKSAIFYASEAKDIFVWTANRFNYTTTWFGPYEVNFNIYPDWMGDDRILVMPIKSALKLGIFCNN